MIWFEILVNQLWKAYPFTLEFFGCVHTADSTHTFFELSIVFFVNICNRWNSYPSICRNSYVCLSTPRTQICMTNQFISLYSNSTTYAHLLVVYPPQGPFPSSGPPFIGPYPSGPLPGCPSPSGLPPQWPTLMVATLSLRSLPAGYCDIGSVSPIPPDVSAHSTYLVAISFHAKIQ
jgi:hypothetical protein